MAEHWVVNASPVILLGKAAVIHLLPLLCDELVIPAEYWPKFSKAGSRMPAGRGCSTMASDSFGLRRR